MTVMLLNGRRMLLLATFLSISIFGIAGCKEDKPAPSAPGYYTGDMKPKATAKSPASGAPASKNQAGAP
jgi:hypothetical protein